MRASRCVPARRKLRRRPFGRQFLVWFKRRPLGSGEKASGPPRAFHLLVTRLCVDVPPSIEGEAPWLVLTQLRTAPRLSSHSLPAHRVDPDYRRRAGCEIDEPAVIADLPVAKQPAQQGQGVLRERRVNKRRLAFKGLKCAAAWFGVVIKGWIANFRE